MCKYCEHGEEIYPSVADDWLDCMEIFIENDRMVITTLGNKDAVVKVNACPMCGRELRGDV